MDSYSRQNAQSHEVKAILFLGVVIVILAMVNGAMSKPPAKPVATYGKEQFPNYLVDPDAGASRVNDIVKKAHGNFESLTPNERRWLDSVSAGHGERMVAERWKHTQAEQNKKSKQAPHNKSEEKDK